MCVAIGESEHRCSDRPFASGRAFVRSAMRLRCGHVWRARRLALAFRSSTAAGPQRAASGQDSNAVLENVTVSFPCPGSARLRVLRRRRGDIACAQRIHRVRAALFCVRMCGPSGKRTDGPGCRQAGRPRDRSRSCGDAGCALGCCTSVTARRRRKRKWYNALGSILVGGSGLRGESKSPALSARWNEGARCHVGAFFDISLPSIGVLQEVG